LDEKFMNTCDLTAFSYPDVNLLIDGEWRSGSDNRWLPVQNPANGALLGHVAAASIYDLDQAAQSALRGFKVWRGTTAMSRRKLMRDAASLLRARTEEISPLITLEQGKPLREARAEVLMAADIIDWFADEAPRIAGRLLASRQESTQIQVMKEAVGPVAAFTPWNFPINQLVRKVAAALSTGCSIVAKAPEETPASPAALIHCFVDAGIPEGVINLVFGDPALISQTLISHPAIRKISFTGSTQVGKQLAAMAGSHMKRATMELGGHAPVIVAPCADPVAAARAFAATKWRNAGQICVSPTRFLVHESLKVAFVDTLVATARELNVGDGFNAETTLGPLANPRRVQSMRRLTDDARKKGAEVAFGGYSLENDAGCFYAPTIVVDAPTDSLLWNEEPFGPIAGVRTYRSLDEALNESNRLPYGLAAYLAARDAATIHYITQGVETGMVWVNETAPAWPELPFGGCKDSGIGSEGGDEALEAYLQTKMVSIKHTLNF
jgi:succinate-semialdehyde dehydrogenase/glutarate-semialdehyde dehydrogenase